MLNSLKLFWLIVIGIFLSPGLLSLQAIATVVPTIAAIKAVNRGPHSALRSAVLLAQQSNFSSFFEDGRMLSDNQLQRRPPAPNLPIDQNSQFWQPVVFRAGGVSFWMPPGQLTEETVVLPTQVGPVRFRTLAANARTSRYLVAYATDLTDTQLSNPQGLLGAVIDRVVQDSKFKLTQTRPMTLSGSQGRELSFKSDTDVITFRAYLSGNRAYVIGARTPASEDTSSRIIMAFLNSLQFLSP